MIIAAYNLIVREIGNPGKLVVIIFTKTKVEGILKAFEQYTTCIPFN